MAGHHFSVGDEVHWAWGRGEGHGHITERFERRVQRTIKGSRITRNGSPANPAYLVEQVNGGRVLKLGSELSSD